MESLRPGRYGPTRSYVRPFPLALSPTDSLLLVAPNGTQIDPFSNPFDFGWLDPGR